MRKFIALLLFISWICTCAAAVQEKVLEINGIPFDRISATNCFEVSVTKGDAPCVKVFAGQEITPCLDVYIENNCLYLGIKEDGITSKLRRTLRIDRIYAEVTVPEISGISITGIASAEFSGNFETDSFNADISGAGIIRNLDINAERSCFNISGTTRIVNSTITSEDVEMSVSGGSETECTINASNASVRLSGTIVFKCDGYVGNMNLKSSGASVIRERGNGLVTGNLDLSLNGVTSCGLIRTDVLSANLSGTSKAKVFVSERIESVNLTGASTLLYSSPDGVTPEIPSLSDIRVSRASLFRKE